MRVQSYISAVIPVYNEAENIVKTVSAIHRYFLERGYTNEIIVVDDGSTDGTAGVLRKNFNSSDIKLISHGHNRGKGAAVKTGMLAASGGVRFFIDADGQISLEYLDEFLEHIIQGYDVVIGSTGLLSARLDLCDYRFFLGSLSKIAIPLVMGWSIRDSQRGFKMFNEEAARTLFGLQTLDGWGFDIEILAIATQAGLKIKEVPITYKASKESKVRVTSYMRTLLELFTVKKNIVMGKYGQRRTDWNSYYNEQRSAPIYIKFFRKTKSKVLVDFIQKYISYPHTMRVVELGGGDSCFYSLIKDRFSPKEYHVVDNNDVSLKKFEDKFGSDTGTFLHRADVLVVQNEPQADLVFSVGLIEHFSPEDTKRAIVGHFSLLSSGGLAIIAFPTPTLLYRFARRVAVLVGKWIYHDERPLTMHEVETTVKEHGTIIEQKIIWPILLTQAVIVAKKK
ncbi:MAG: glycosyltransferase [bacterium]|nr:glycosyltransferase [bacterium]MDZ4285086.1 glycosyltransferase [Patescibacteria group bacterium]